MKRLKIISAAVALTFSLFAVNAQAALEAGAKALISVCRVHWAVNL